MNTVLMDAIAETNCLLPLVETDASASVEEMRAVMVETGYLFFRGLVPQLDVQAVRREVLELCAEAGWLNADAAMVDGIVGPDVVPTMEGRPDYLAMYRKMLRLPSFHNFPCNTSLLRIAQGLLGEDILVHPRRIGRVTFPNLTSATTPPHQDYHYIRGTAETYTCWMPLGDCPMDLGGLAVWPGSHRLGFLEHSVYDPAAVGGRAVPVDDDVPWHASPFEAGDALFFHSHTIHKALPNLSGNRLRISTDNRYQRAQDSIDPGSLRPHADLY